ncbi:hypothetical protein G6O69_08020 [Pseudenhygromyxa sp. WMMC2535]|uniref:hypothetical protein n=1 Tax=Pseudenhygromyxa sp. WMMC2535 TaxID=2712867 RepID=UPI0015533C35|nr:hypothetical protein [Pseudenhygromyxa sp. WMMC2535]NVB37776.1 hypothetical protein [Pseudenhygromyxa sp. WMMC2535]
MRDRRMSMLVLAVAALLWLTTGTRVLASAQVVVPPGWSQSSGAVPEAQRRAQRWHEALGLHLVQVASAQDHGFAETAAVFERLEPVPERAFASEAVAVATLADVVAPLVGTESPSQSGMRVLDSGAQVAWAQWTVDDMSIECVLAPSGDTASVVVFAVLSRDAPHHRATIDKMIASLEGVSAPMPRFSLESWRIGSIVVWLLLAGLLHALMLAFVDRERDHKQAGQRAAAILLGVVAIGTLASVAILRPRELALVHADSSVSSLAVWIGVSGLIVAGLHFMFASRFDYGVVRSAPASGAFASGSYSSSMIRASLSRTGAQPRMEDIAAASDVWPMSDEMRGNPNQNQNARPPGDSSGRPPGGGQPS